MEEIKLYKYATYVLGFIVILSVVLNITTVMILNDVVEMQESHVNLTVDDSMRINNLERAVYHDDYTEYVSVDVDIINTSTYKFERMSDETIENKNWVLHEDSFNLTEKDLEKFEFAIIN